MSEMKETHRFTLYTPLNYHSRSGDQEQAGWIELHAPSTRNSDECAALRQAFMRTIGEKADEDAEEVEVEGTPEGPDPLHIINAMAMSTSVDLPAVMKVAKKLFSSGVALVEGEVKLTNKLIESMTMEDFERMLGEYLVNFTLASTLVRKEKSSTDR